MLSDESSSDSDSGIRFKTQSTRAERQTDAATGSRFPGRGGGRDRMNRSFEDRRFGDRRDRFDERTNRFQDRRSPIHNRGRDRRGSPPRRRMSPHSRDRHSPQRDRNAPQIRDHERRRSSPRDKFRRISPSERVRKLSREKHANPPKSEHSAEKIKMDKCKKVERYENSRDKREVRRPDDTHEKRRDFRGEIKKNLVPLKEPKRNSEKPTDKSCDEKKAPPPRQTVRTDERFQMTTQRSRQSSDKVNPHGSPPGRYSRRSISHELDGNKRKHSLHDQNPNKIKRHSPDITSPKPIHKVKHISTSREPKVEVVEPKILSDMEEQPTSYYNIIPETLKGSTEKIVLDESSEDEETLRAKLLHLEKELKKTKKGKSKKKEKKHKKSKDKRRSKDQENTQVSSTTDIVHVTEIEIVSEHHEGPALPPHLQPTTRDLREDISTTQPRKLINESNEEGEIVTDTEEPPIDIDATDLRHRLKKGIADSSRIVSPDLRVKLKTRSSGESGSQEEGPALPPNLTTRNIGPSIPSNMREVLAKRPVQKCESSSEDEGIGPLPQSDQSKWTKAHESLEERALKMKIDALDDDGGKDKGKAREEWMLELPDAKAKIIGLGPRQFRAKAAPDMSDRSTWTDTPEERARKATGTHVQPTSSVDIQREAELRHQEEKDHEHELAIKKHKKKHKRDESLLDLHEKKLKKKKKKEEKEKGSSEKVRRPFSRDTDLQVNRFDEAQKKSIIKKAQHLDTRFSRGEAKFL